MNTRAYLPEISHVVDRTMIMCDLDFVSHANPHLRAPIYIYIYQGHLYTGPDTPPSPVGGGCTPKGTQLGQKIQKIQNFPKSKKKYFRKKKSNFFFCLFVWEMNLLF